VADTEDHPMSSFTDRARSALSRIEQDERVRSTTAAARNVAAQAEGVSQTVSRKVAQDDAWDELRGDVQLLTEIALELELIKGGHVIGTCPVRAHWELVAQHLAGAPLGDQAQARGRPGVARTTFARRLKDTAIPHAVSVGVAFAVSVHPLGTIAGEGTRLIRARIEAGTDQADALHRLGRDLGTLRAQADGELADLTTGRSSA